MEKGHHNSWKLVKLIIQTLFMLSFDQKTMEELKYTNIVLFIEKTIASALETGEHNDVVLDAIKVCSFYSQDETLWSQMISRSFIRALFMMLSLKDKDEKRYPLSVLNDILPSPTAIKFIKELPYKEGMNKLYSLYPKEQIETILKKIYDEHKNLHGFPVPADFLNKHPSMKTSGALAIANQRLQQIQARNQGKHTLPDIPGAAENPKIVAKGGQKSSHPALKSGLAAHDGSSKLDSIKRLSLKQIVQNKKFGTPLHANMNMSVQESANSAAQSAADNRLQTPVSITASRIEGLGPVNEESKLVEKYLHELDSNKSLDFESDANLAFARPSKPVPKTSFPSKLQLHNDIFPDDSVSVADRVQATHNEISVRDDYTGSSIIGRGDQDTFYKQRERIRRLQKEKMNVQR